MRIRNILLAAFVGAMFPVAPAFAQGDKESCAVDKDPMSLKPGQFVWAPEIAPASPLTIIISLPQQRAYVFRNGVQIGAASISSGRKGFETPTGMFRVLEKDADHRSNLYDDAPMPFMLRLTWDGVALHAGNDPGRPQSHGCIRLPLAFAKSLFTEVPIGSLVVVTDKAVNSGLRYSPSLLAGAPLALTPDAADHWSPEIAAEGQVTLVLSGADKSLAVMRGGAEIGKTHVEIEGHEPLHTHALLLMAAGHGEALQGSGDWMLIDLPGDKALPKERRHAHDIDRIRMSPEFAARLATVLKPGATMLISDKPLGVAGETDLRVFGSTK